MYRFYIIQYNYKIYINILRILLVGDTQNKSLTAINRSNDINWYDIYVFLEKPAVTSHLA